MNSQISVGAFLVTIFPSRKPTNILFLNFSPAIDCTFWWNSEQSVPVGKHSKAPPNAPTITFIYFINYLLKRFDSINECFPGAL
jgi:hypothetical protein